MNFLGNMRISHKISALMVGLIMGFIVIGVTYYVQIKIENNAGVAEQESLSFRNQLAGINGQVVAAVVAGQAYLKQPSQDSLDQYQAGISSVETSFNQLRTVVSESSQADPERAPLLNNLFELFNQYNASFQKLLNAQSNGDNAELLERQQQLTNALLTIDQSQFSALVPQWEAKQLLTLVDLRAIDRQLSGPGIDAVARQNAVQKLDNYRQAYNELLRSQQRSTNLATELREAENTLSSQLASALAIGYATNAATDQANAEQRQVLQAIVTAIIFAVAMGTAVGVYFLYKSIVFPMVHIQSVIGKINRGKTATRVKVLSGDELGDLGKAFNQLLDERIKQLEDRSLENDQLNNSIISLIKALGLIAQKDLTVKVPVSPDITGTVSDAVNLLTTETARTLEEVRHISEQVNAISEHLQEQSGLVIQFADGEKRQIIATSKALEVLARAMSVVASHAETADKSAAKAIENTQQARHSVEQTVHGIRAIRETISETEKRTKRLGDRSQEISGIVNLINTIAERTHILALNASMHAASAGEAGRGFAVVADEVQRLAESARQSTDEIASMVNNMRVETSDTVAIMNTLISQVADGSRLAEEAGKRMTATEEATQALVADVKHIAAQAIQQAEVANRVRDRSGVIRKFTDKTGKQLEEQKLQTDSLKKLADTLVQQVNVFTLPASEKRVVSLAIQKANDRKDIGDDKVSHLHAAS
jgi:twitching motility protein PilJ